MLHFFSDLGAEDVCYLKYEIFQKFTTKQNKQLLKNCFNQCWGAAPLLAAPTTCLPILAAPSPVPAPAYATNLFFKLYKI